MSTEKLDPMEAAKAELAAARKIARERNKNLQTKTSGGKRNPYVKEFSGKDFKEDTPYYIAFLNLVPIVGACHWFSADDDVTDDGKRYNSPRNCCANGRDDLSYGKNPAICPACWLGNMENEYYQEHNSLPEGYLQVDTYKGKPNGPQYMIYYYAMVAEGETVYERQADGTKKKTVELKWWDDPIALGVKPSINTTISEHLDNIEENGGDIRTYLWMFKKKAGSGFDKYAETAPLSKNGSLVPVPKKFISNRADYIKLLPTPEELIKPVSPTEMADMLNLKDWDNKKNSQLTEKPSEKVTDAINVGDENPPFNTDSEDVFDVGSDLSAGSDESVEDELDLGDLDILN